MIITNLIIILLYSCSFHKQVFEEPVAKWQNVGGKNLLVITKLNLHINVILTTILSSLVPEHKDDFFSLCLSFERTYSTLTVKDGATCLNHMLFSVS